MIKEFLAGDGSLFSDARFDSSRLQVFVKLQMSVASVFSFEPMLCQGMERLPEGSEWHYELTLDGFRAIGRKAGRGAQLWSRNQKSLSRRFPSVVKGINGLPDDTIIHGEVVALNQHGRPSFDLLQGARDRRATDRALSFRRDDAAGPRCAGLAARGAARRAPPSHQMACPT
jgi:ATP-dependent DNA ligase